MSRDEPLRDVDDRFHRRNTFRLRINDEADALYLTGYLHANDAGSPAYVSRPAARADDAAIGPIAHK